MKSKTVHMTFSVIIFMLLTQLSCFALDIVKNGKPEAVIVIAADAGMYQKRAAIELKKYINLISGAALQIVPENKIPKASAVISIGHTKLAAKAGITTDGFKNDWRRLTVKNNVLYLIGRDQHPLQPTPALSPYAGAQGSFAAVAVFLRDVLGCRWFVPCPMGVYVPRMKNITVPDNLDIISKPGFAFPHIYGRDLVCSYANNCRMTCRIKLFGYHTWAIMFDYRKWFSEHPEFYAVGPDGKRVRQRSYLCTSNPELNKQFVKNIRKLFDDGFDLVQLGQADGWRACNCPECMQIDKHRDYRTVTRDQPCEKILLMHNWIIRECAKSHPDKKIQLVIYSPSLWPSRRDLQPYTNVTGIFCPVPEQRNPLSAMDEKSGQCISDWRKKNITEFAEYQYFFDNLINPLGIFPEVSPEWLKAKMKWNLARGITSGGGYVVALGWPLLYSYSRMGDNPDIDPYEPVREYCRFIFGKAAPEMEKFYREFYRDAGKVWLNRGMIFRSKYPAETAFTSSWSPADVTELDRLLKEAESKVDSERAKGFLRKTRFLFDGFKYLATMFFAKKKFDAARTEKNLLKVKQCVENVEKWREDILSLYAKDRKFLKDYWPKYEVLTIILMSKGLSWGPAYGKIKSQLPAASRGEISFRGMGIGSHIAHAEINKPITWDFEKMLRSLAKTGDVKEVYRVMFTRAKPERDGKINFKAWSEVPAISLNPYLGTYQVGKANGTSVKAVYDTDNLYVLFECAEPAIQALKTYAGPRDGRVYGFDSIELFIDPKCAPDKTFQFVVSPAENAIFDAACDYSVSAENPDKPSKNPKWNCNFNYLYYLDKSTKKWFIQIAVPFKSIGELTPRDGAVWFANFCRNRHANLKSSEMSSWIPGTFGHDPGIFGKLIFSRKQ